MTTVSAAAPELRRPHTPTARRSRHRWRLALALSGLVVALGLTVAIWPATDHRQGSGASAASAAMREPAAATIETPPLLRQVEILGPRKQLVSAGYSISVDGRLDPVTKSALAEYLQLDAAHPLSPALAAALRGTGITGRRDPDAWTSRFGLDRRTRFVERRLTGPGGQLDSNGNLRPVATAPAALRTGASASGLVDLFDFGDLHESLGQGDGKDLRRGVAYGAGAFPLALHVRPPDGRWTGGQFESGRFRFVQLHHLRTGNTPLHGYGFVTIETAAGSTPSIAATTQHLRATPHISAGAVTAVRVAGFTGRAFDATITGFDRPPWCKTHACGRGVSLVPFGPNLHCGSCTHTMHGETLDAKFGGTGQLFRIMVIDVRGKTVVVYLESNFADQPRFSPATIFPTFLPYAERLLAAVRFPSQ